MVFVAVVVILVVVLVIITRPNRRKSRGAVTAGVLMNIDPGVMTWYKWVANGRPWQ